MRLPPCKTHRKRRQCLLRQAPHICTTLTCPHCKARLTTPADPPYEPNTIIPAATGLKMMVRYSSGDDGTPEDVDMLPLLTEEAMVIMYPHTARAHTLHDYCALGDTVGISKCLMEAEALSSVGRSMTPAELLVWCDPLRHGRTCLHAAVQHQRYDVAWLLLYVASTLPIAYFSPAILHAVRNLGISRRPEVDAAADIRSIVDINGDTPEMLALQIGGVWDQDLELGVLAPPEVPSGLHVLPPAPPVPLMASMEPTFEA